MLKLTSNKIKMPVRNNVLIAGVLGSFVVATFFYTMYAVGNNDEIGAAVVKIERERKEAK